MTPVALVTGAARGIGLACAQRLGRDGYTIVAADIDGETLEASVRDLQAEGVSIEGRRLDVANTGAGRRLVDQLVATHGRIDALINNAGFTERLFVQDLTPQAWERMLEVHVRGPVFLTQAVARDMVRRGEPGAVVNLSSIRAESAEPGQMHYCAAKGALRTLTRAIAQELAPHRIRVNCVGAGLTATDMTADVRADAETMAQRRAQVPLSRYAQPEEIAACAAFLLSDDAGHITGATLHVDGGYLAV